MSPENKQEIKVYRKMKTPKLMSGKYSPSPTLGKGSPDGTSRLWRKGLLHVQLQVGWQQCHDSGQVIHSLKHLS